MGDFLLESVAWSHNSRVETALRRATRGEFVCLSELLAAKEKLLQKYEQSRDR